MWASNWPDCYQKNIFIDSLTIKSVIKNNFSGNLYIWIFTYMIKFYIYIINFKREKYKKKFKYPTPM